MLALRQNSKGVGFEMKRDDILLIEQILESYLRVRFVFFFKILLNTQD